MGTGLASLLALFAGQPAPPSRPPAPGDAFQELTRRAAEARERGELEASAKLYRQAVAAKPSWGEGWWFLGTLAYESDRPEECRAAFTRFLTTSPAVGPAWGLRGLCQFQLKQYTAAASDFRKALDTGPLNDDPIWRVVSYHDALLMLRSGAFERAIPRLRELAEARGGDELVEACGLLLLRRRWSPEGSTAETKDLVRTAGRAECTMLAGRRGEAETAFAELVERYPKVRNVNYAHGLFFASQGTLDKAIAAYSREIELHPDHVLAHVELAFGLVKRGEPREAVKPAETAVRLDPGLFVAHFALGRARVETGDVPGGLLELEQAARLAPGAPEIQLALARAFERAGRPADAERANRRFLELEEKRRARSGEPR